jgi:hypothetical protein
MRVCDPRSPPGKISGSDTAFGVIYVCETLFSARGRRTKANGVRFVSAFKGLERTDGRTDGAFRRNEWYGAGEWMEWRFREWWKKKETLCRDNLGVRPPR